MNSLKLITLLLLSTITLISCDDDETTDDPRTGETAKYVVATTSGVFPTQSSYLQSITSLDVEGTLQNTEAIELNGPIATIEAKGKHIYAGLFGEPASLYKFKANDDQTFTEEGIIQVDGASTFSGMLLESETEAYFHTFGIDKIFKFNPTTFAITGEIDLDPVLKEDFMMLKAGIVKRGNKLFVPVDFKDYASFESLLDAAFVLVADLSTGDVQLISDERTKIIDGSDNALPLIMKNEQNDIYVQAWGEEGVLPGGILRIKNGEEDFDPAYFLNLTEETSSYVSLGVNYLTPNTAITAAQTKDGDFYDDAVFSFFKVDLQNQQLAKIDGLPEAKAYAASKFLPLDNNTFLFPLAAANENSLYEYNASEGSAVKVFSTADPIAAILSLQD